MKSVTLEKDYSIKLSSNVVDYIYPDYVFIPMYENYNLQVKNKELVKKEQVLLSNYNNITLISPISGTVVGAKECLLANGNKEKCLVIENDFKEKMKERTTIRKNLKQLSKADFLKMLKEKSILKSDNSKELMLNVFEKNTIKKIIVNGIEDEPYIATKIFGFKNNFSEILETISFLSSIFKTEENIIVLKNNDRENIDILSNILGTYPEILLNLVPDIYPIGKIEILSQNVNINPEETIFLTPEDLIIIYNLIKKNKCTCEKYITISGNAIVNPLVIKTKIGVAVKKIIDEHINFINNNEVTYIVNGLMGGFSSDITDLIVTNELDGIIINFKENYNEGNCINCGKCLEVCPVNIDPNWIFNNKNNTELKNRCINCGLCTYICPVYINFKKRIKELNNEE